MNINRHNYEEYFILYMDNELSVEERRLVEEFVAEYPDLKEELDQLMQYKLQPEAIELPGKEELWKGSTLIHSGNQTEWLLLYLDGALSNKENSLVEQYLREEPAAAAEWAVLQKTRLIPEAIIFENKHSLYRQEEKQRRIVPLFLFRIAAALILAAIGLGLIFIFNGREKADNTKAPMARTEEKNPSDESKLINTAPVTDPTAMNEEPSDKNENSIQVESKYPEVKEKDKNRLVKESNNILTDEVAVEKEKENKPSNNLPLPVNNPRIKLNDNVIAYSKPEEEVLKNDKNNKLSDVTNPAITPSDIKTAAFDPNETLEDENGSGKKNRRRGIFRTIARTFEKRTKVDPTDDDKLLVAGFRINLK